MQKTTRAFRTISEAGDELDLQPHVLRFWESKFSEIQPIKRGGGRRFYRPEDIEFIRGIKYLLHEEKHAIKDVKKLIRVKGQDSVSELGRSIEKAARERQVSDTILVPERIRKAAPGEIAAKQSVRQRVVPFKRPAKSAPVAAPEPTAAPQADKSAANELAEALARMQKLKSRLGDYAGKT